jgi:hypothetical protein
MLLSPEVQSLGTLKKHWSCGNRKAMARELLQFCIQMFIAQQKDCIKSYVKGKQEGQFQNRGVC